METAVSITQLFFTIIIGMYFFTQLKNSRASVKDSEESKKETEKLHNMRRISLTEPFTERMRPSSLSEIEGQKDGIEALKAALCGRNPQHILIYGPPGVGKTAAARAALLAAKESMNTPFRKNSPFVEVDASIMRYDERSIADPLIGSVHDPIYQGAGEFGAQGIPKPKMGAVSRAHGGVLFIDEIGELHQSQMNKLLKVLEDRKVTLESAYYSSADKNIPLYIHDMFCNGIPADFRLIGATTRKPEEIPPALRSRCTEIFFEELSKSDIEKIIANAADKFNIVIGGDEIRMIAKYAKNGRDAVKFIQTLCNIAELDGRKHITAEDIQKTAKSGHYEEEYGEIIDISFIKPRGN